MDVAVVREFHMVALVAERLEHVPVPERVGHTKLVLKLHSSCREHKSLHDSRVVKF